MSTFCHATFYHFTFCHVIRHAVLFVCHAALSISTSDCLKWTQQHVTKSGLRHIIYYVYYVLSGQRSVYATIQYENMLQYCFTHLQHSNSREKNIVVFSSLIDMRFITLLIIIERKGSLYNRHFTKPRTKPVRDSGSKHISCISMYHRGG